MSSVSCDWLATNHLLREGLGRFLWPEAAAWAGLQSPKEQNCSMILQMHIAAIMLQEWAWTAGEVSFCRDPHGSIGFNKSLPILFLAS